MPAIKCPYCGHRNFHVSGRCPNCGTALIPSAPEPPPASDRIVAFYEPPPPPTIPRSKQQTESRRAIEPYKSSSVVPANSRRAWHPASVRSEELDPYQSQEFGQTIITEERSQFTPVTPPVAPLEGKYPWWFPRRAPDILGQVIQVQSNEEAFHSLDFFTGAVKVIRDMIWVDRMDYNHNKEKETLFVTRMRIRTDRGIQKDARIMGHFTGGNINLGDTVALWGWRRRGILRVRRAFNHTAQSVVTTRAMASPVPFMLSIVLVLAVLILFMLLNHIALPLPGLHLLPK